MIASRSIGAPTTRLLLRHMLPNSLTPLIVAATLALATAIIDVAGLGFLGLGPADPRTRSGARCSPTRLELLRQAPWLIFFPGAAISIVGHRVQPARRRPARVARPADEAVTRRRIAASRSRPAAPPGADLVVRFRTHEGTIHAVNGVSFDLAAGERLGLVGESGCGKSVTSLAIIRLLPKPAGRIEGGQVVFDGLDLVTLPEDELREIRGRDIAMIFQDPMTSLNPVLTDRGADGRDDPGPQAGRHARRPARGPSSCWRWSASRSRRSGCKSFPAPVLRRHAPARDDRDGARPRAAADDRRRADDGPRRDDPGAGPGAPPRLTTETGTALILITHDLGVVAGMTQRINTWLCLPRLNSAYCYLEGRQSMRHILKTPTRLLLLLTAAGALAFLDAGASSAVQAQREPQLGTEPGAGREDPRGRFGEKTSPFAGPGDATAQRNADGRLAATSMLATRPSVSLSSCADDAEWLCGVVKVPVDRAKPTGRKLGLKVAVFPHTNPDSTRRDPVFATDGGPGASNYINRGFLHYINDGLTEDRDLVVVDHRGTGSSGAINCPALQSNLGDPYVDHQLALKEIGDCGRSLGGDADRYGSGDIAMDLDAVRAALGYNKINLYGLSYGGTFLSAYATRYPDRLRSLVIDAGTPATDPRHSWTWGWDIPPAMATQVGLHCRRAPACANDQPDARTALARLAAAVREHPFTGTADISGQGVRTVKVTELGVATVASEPFDAAELAATADALDRGDKAPLVRLVGESMRPYEPTPYEEFSDGASAATFCNDNDFVWSRSDPVNVRKAKYNRAYADLGPQAFAPFSKKAWTDRFLSDYCTYWPAPDRFTPANPKGVTVSKVPTLIISGDIDTAVPTNTTRQLLRIFPKATFAKIAGAGHPAAGWSDAPGWVSRSSSAASAPLR